jgi:hypothetical protein
MVEPLDSLAPPAVWRHAGRGAHRLAGQVDRGGAPARPQRVLGGLDQVRCTQGAAAGVRGGGVRAWREHPGMRVCMTQHAVSLC